MWISRKFSTDSVVYGTANPLHKHCTQTGRLLNKNTGVQKVPGFAHMLLWISSGFSTAQFVNGFLCQAADAPGRDGKTDFFEHRSSDRYRVGIVAIDFWERATAGRPAVPDSFRGAWFTLKRFTFRIIVVVNSRHFLWISWFTREKSMTWRRYKALAWAVCSWGQIWTKISLCIKAVLFTNGPVDMQTLIHRLRRRKLLG